MLKKTFCHIDGISKETEKLLWDKGIHTWKDFNKNFDNLTFLSELKRNKIKSEILFSEENLNNNNLKYFENKLDKSDHFRISNHGKIAFVDIETTGLSKYTNQITMIGIYDGKNAKSYVAGIDLNEAYEKLKEFDIIVTFNGKQFDLPFIEYKSNISYDFIHLDLRFMLKELGLSGGLKKIEQELGICRDEEIAEVNGLEAVRLWRRYKMGDNNALNKLLKYNYEDIVNLKYLLEYYIKNKLI